MMLLKIGIGPERKMPWLTIAKVRGPRTIPITDPAPPISGTPPIPTHIIALKMRD